MELAMLPHLLSPSLKASEYIWSLSISGTGNLRKVIYILPCHRQPKAVGFLPIIACVPGNSPGTLASCLLLLLVLGRWVVYGSSEQL